MKRNLLQAHGMRGKHDLYQSKDDAKREYPEFKRHGFQHIYDHASGMIALLFVSPNGTVEGFDVKGFDRTGEFASVAEAAAFACADVEMSRIGDASLMSGS